MRDEVHLQNHENTNLFGRNSVGNEQDHQSEEASNQGYQIVVKTIRSLSKQGFQYAAGLENSSLVYPDLSISFFFFFTSPPGRDYK